MQITIGYNNFCCIYVSPIFFFDFMRFWGGNGKKISWRSPHPLARKSWNCYYKTFRTYFYIRREWPLHSSDHTQPGPPVATSHLIYTVTTPPNPYSEQSRSILCRNSLSKFMLFQDRLLVGNACKFLGLDRSKYEPSDEPPNKKSKHEYS